MAPALRIALIGLLVAACGGGASEVSTSAEPDDDPVAAAPTKAGTKGPPAPPAPAPADCDACKDGECRPEDAKACHAQSETYRWGNGAAFDMTKHGDFAERACNGGYMPDCSVLAMLHQDGIGGRAHDDAKAAQLHRKACDGGAGIGCFNLALMVEGGGDGVADPDRARPLYDKAIELLEKSCDDGDVQWCANVGYMYGAGHGVPQDQAKAIAAYQRGCPKHANSCANLALALIDGRGTAQDIPRARTLLETGCSQGNMWSCAHMGSALLSGRPGLDPDPEGAVEYATKACDHGHSLGCITMALAHGTGKGVAHNFNLALDFSERGCAMGDSSACKMAVDELVARKGAADPSRVRGLLEAGCKIGAGPLCSGYGQMLAAGAGGDADPEGAKRAFSEGCRRGDMYSCMEVIKSGGEPEIRPEEMPRLKAAICQSGVQEACDD